jgi:hypothetical protein
VLEVNGKTVRVKSTDNPLVLVEIGAE